MVQTLRAFISSENLCSQSDQLLLAVSGGVDSVVLCYLLKQLGFSFGIAHCNFQLRGTDSDGDAEFVQQLAEQFGVPFHSICFDTKSLLIGTNESTQSLARKLRYDWFNNILTKETYTYVATAHHKNDQAETILYKLAKGTGIRGIRGMLSKRNQIIRPLLCFTKEQLLTYAKQYKIAYREDASNATTDYQRNLIRHELVPVLEQLNPRFIENLYQSSQHFLDLEQLLAARLAEVKAQAVVQAAQVLQIDYPQFQDSTAASTLLFELLAPAGFSSDQVRQIERTFPKNGRQFFSKTHELLIHQKHLLLRPKPKAVFQPFDLDKDVVFIQIDATKSLKISFLDKKNVQFTSNPNLAYVDATKLVYPLTVRTWKDGDSFCPFGMKGKRQKLQNFYSNQKLSLFEKEATYLLCSEDKICWVVGKRMDERFKVDEETKRVVCFEVV